MAEIQWFYPRDPAEVPPLLAREGVILHGGGTGLLRGGMSQVRGLVDIRRLGLERIHRDNGGVRIGAGASYRTVADAACRWHPAHVLARSLLAAATTPLRNRITIGGSIALFPYWSDLMGPLLALEAEVHLVGPAPGWLPLPEYVGQKASRRGCLITEVRWLEQGWSGAYRRWTRTRTDRPAFSLTVLARRGGSPDRPGAGTTPEVRVVLVGCSGRYRRLSEVEQSLASGTDPATAAGRAELEIPTRMGASGEYLTHCARVELERALNDAMTAAANPKSGTQGG